MRDDSRNDDFSASAAKNTPPYLKADQLPWTPWVMEGLAFKLISVDLSTGGFSLFLRVDPGAQIPTHGHIGSVEGIVLSGSFTFDNEVSEKGDFFFDYGGSLQQPVSKEGCTLFLSASGPLVAYNADTDTTVVIDARRVYDIAKEAGMADHITPVFT
ncbi:MAG: cupin domain-containing protein [Pseudomonadota bacterium]